MNIYAFANSPGLFFLEDPSCKISEETLLARAGYKVTVDMFLKYELLNKFGKGFFETENEEGVVTDILLKAVGYVF